MVNRQKVKFKLEKCQIQIKRVKKIKILKRFKKLHKKELFIMEAIVIYYLKDIVKRFHGFNKQLLAQYKSFQVIALT